MVTVEPSDRANSSRRALFMVSDGPLTKRYDAETDQNEEFALRTVSDIEKKSWISKVRAANNLVKEGGADVPQMLVSRAQG